MFTIEKIYKHNYIYIGVYASSEFVKFNIGISYVYKTCMADLIEFEKPIELKEIKEFVIIKPKEKKMFSGI